MDFADLLDRIVLTGQELLTSNMMVRWCWSRAHNPKLLETDLTLPFLQVFPMACINGAVPWWGMAVNWIVGGYLSYTRNEYL